MEAERNRERMVANKARTVKMFCPSLSKTVLFVAWDEQRLDLGSIARNFGLDPATLKLNGHFIGRGVDFIASSVTWNTLLSFFSARGLPTGKDDQDALVVDGKLSKVGTKRPHDPRDAVNGRCNVTEYEAYGDSRKPQPEDVNLLENKKLKETNLGSGDLLGLGIKRKQLLDDVSQFKRLKINENHSDIRPRGRDNDLLRNDVTRTQFTCSYMGINLKRTREDEATIASPCKRIRQFQY